MKTDLSRREFIGKSSIYGSVLSLSLTNFPKAMAAVAKSEKPEVLSKEEWDTIAAVTGRIIPTDDSPGAIEANCVNFVDKALANEESQYEGFIKIGVKGLNEYCFEAFNRAFRNLQSDQQDAVLTKMESNEIDSWPAEAGQSAQFFGLLRALTIMGFLADPKYGGNRDHLGWKTAGYPGPRHHRGGYSPAQMMGTEVIKPIWKS